MESEHRALIRKLKGSIRSESVLSALERVSRDIFVPHESRHMAYENIPLTSAQNRPSPNRIPYIVALIVEALEFQGHRIVLDVGTGSRYQAAMITPTVPTGRLITVGRLKTLIKPLEIYSGF